MLFAFRSPLFWLLAYIIACTLFAISVFGG